MHIHYMDANVLEPVWRSNVCDVWGVPDGLDQ
jgi:hypothetical protein